jgi:hypothetical protein
MLGMIITHGSALQDGSATPIVAVNGIKGHGRELVGEGTWRIKDRTIDESHDSLWLLYT